MAHKHQYKEARSPSSPGKKLDHISIHPGEDGGHVVEHHFAEDGMVYHKPATHVFGKDEGHELMAHLKTHAKIHDAGGEHESEEDYSEGAD